MLAIQTEPSSPSLSRVPLDEVLPSSLGRMCCHWVSRIMCWRLTASCMDRPSIFPPGAIQKSIVCPGHLQLGHIMVCGGSWAGRAMEVSGRCCCCPCWAPVTNPDTFLLFHIIPSHSIMCHPDDSYCLQTDD